MAIARHLKDGADAQQPLRRQDSEILPQTAQCQHLIDDGD
jgi:hypothetical protein